ncbi:hypothetical protein P691DRAFT_766295 [Macrolepiota fuliginosa MF-IS2]|uniref:Uncharacterized protein n=1 Tax=Macrolepiota fuliginosa MF-IS2 TaxID=1400762 RepID=A0A9P6BXE3_9AGAR|nr:hypothetical protein P691DRAFT_766295 [Macrolepiota fuliginosa MF-IS2]
MADSAGIADGAGDAHDAQHQQGDFLPAPAYNAQHFPPATEQPPPRLGPAQFLPANLAPPSQQQTQQRQAQPQPQVLPQPYIIYQHPQQHHMPSQYSREAPKFDGHPRSLG